MDKLTKLAIKYKTDKWGKHHYTPHYYGMFKNNTKRRSVKKVLEIGVAEGAGVKMFRDFFTNATIYGAEIADNRLIKEDRIETFKCDQGSLQQLMDLVGKIGNDIDFVVDDGSHRTSDQFFTCAALVPMLKKDVTYVIEDVAEVGLIDLLDLNYVDRFSCELINCGPRYDDNLLVVKR